MTFEKHINEINRKVMGSLTFVNRVKDCFDRDTRNVIVQSIVLSILNYCNTICGTANSTHLNDIQKLQNFAAKVVDGKAKEYDHVTPILKDSKWLTIKDQITHDTAVAIFKYSNNYHPDYLLQLPTVSNIVF